MRIVLSILLVVTFENALAQVCGTKDTSYYRNAEIKQFPAKPLEQISSADAQFLEEQGDVYFVYVKCENGEPISLTKRWNHKMYFEIKYLYQDDRLIGQKSINANGETNEYYVK